MNAFVEVVGIASVEVVRIVDVFVITAAGVKEDTFVAGNFESIGIVTSVTGVKGFLIRVEVY